MKRIKISNEKKWMVRKWSSFAISLGIMIGGILLFFRFCTDKNVIWDYAGIVISIFSGSWSYYFYNIKYTKRKESRPRKRSKIEKFWMFQKIILYILSLVIAFVGDMLIKFSENYKDIGLIVIVIGIIIYLASYLESFEDYKKSKGEW